jgi:hypothetical protein
MICVGNAPNGLLPFAQIISKWLEKVIRPIIDFTGMKELIDVDSIVDPEIKTVFKRIM